MSEAGANFKTERLVNARTAQGLRSKDLAQRVGLSAGAISQYENGRKVPTVAVVRRLASELDVVPDYFYADSDRELVVGDVFWRRLSRVPKLTIEGMKVRAGRLAKVISEVEPSPGAALPDLSDLTPEQAAIAVRAELGFAWDEPVFSVVDVLERLGVWVHQLNEDEDRSVDAFYTFCAGIHLVYMNPAKQDPWRSRISAGHELGHALRDDVPASGRDAKRQQENEATIFGSELILPTEAWLRRCPRRGLTNPWSYMEQKGQVGLSVKALMTKTFRAGRMTAREYKSAMTRYAKLGWNKGEPQPWDRHIETATSDDVPRRLQERLGQTSLPALSAATGLTTDGLQQLLGLPRGGPMFRALPGGRRSSTPVVRRGGNLSLLPDRRD